MQPIFCRLRRRALRLALLPAVFLLLAALCALPADAAAPAGTYVRTPAAPGTVVHGNAKAGFDASNASQGYIMAWYGGSADKVKVQITAAGAPIPTTSTRRDARRCSRSPWGTGPTPWRSTNA